MIFGVLTLKFDEDKAYSLPSQILTKSTKKHSKDEPLFQRLFRPRSNFRIYFKDPTLALYLLVFKPLCSG